MSKSKIELLVGNNLDSKFIFFLSSNHSVSGIVSVVDTEYVTLSDDYSVSVVSLDQIIALQIIK
jgi:hypothetical protein